MRFAVNAALFVAAIAALLAAWIVLVGLAARPGRADVAIVFGSAVEVDGQPSARLLARLDVARALYRSRRVRTLFVSGGVGRTGFDEALVMRLALLRAGVPDRDIALDRTGSNTAKTAAHARAYMQANGLRSAIVVTQYFHIVRATLACRRAGIPLAGACAPIFFEPRDVYSIAREVVALPVYFLARR